MTTESMPDALRKRELMLKMVKYLWHNAGCPKRVQNREKNP